MISNTTKIARKIKNRNFAIAIDAPARLVKPRMPAINPITKKTKAHLSMENSILLLGEGTPAATVGSLTRLGTFRPISGYLAVLAKTGISKCLCSF